MYLVLCVHAVLVTSYVEIPPQKIPYGSLFFLIRQARFQKIVFCGTSPHTLLVSLS